MLIGCKEFVLFQQKSGGRFVLLSRRIGDLIESHSNCGRQAPSSIFIFSSLVSK